MVLVGISVLPKWGLRAVGMSNDHVPDCCILLLSPGLWYSPSHTDESLARRGGESPICYAPGRRNLQLEVTPALPNFRNLAQRRLPFAIVDAAVNP